MVTNSQKLESKTVFFFVYKGLLIKPRYLQGLLQKKLKRNAKKIINLAN